MSSYKLLFEELYQGKIRYVVAGGFAVNFHQVQRATADLDLIVHLETSNLLLFLDMMTKLGYVPRLPVPARDFADADKRKVWIKEKGMLMFSFIMLNNPFELIDIFVEEPIEFEQLWASRLDVSAFGGIIHVISKEHLIELKRKAGRDKDEFDIRQLQKIK